MTVMIVDIEAKTIKDMRKILQSSAFFSKNTERQHKSKTIENRFKLTHTCSSSCLRSSKLLSLKLTAERVRRQDSANQLTMFMPWQQSQQIVQIIALLEANQSRVEKGLATFQYSCGKSSETRTKNFKVTLISTLTLSLTIHTRCTRGAIKEVCSTLLQSLILQFPIRQMMMIAKEAIAIKITILTRLLICWVFQCKDLSHSRAKKAAVIQTHLQMLFRQLLLKPVKEGESCFSSNGSMPLAALNQRTIFTISWTFQRNEAVLLPLPELTRTRTTFLRVSTRWTLKQKRSSSSKRISMVRAYHGTFHMLIICLIKRWMSKTS